MTFRMSKYTTADRLKLDSAVSSTEQTLRKWQKIAYGVGRASDPLLQRAAVEMCDALLTAMQRFQENVRT